MNPTYKLRAEAWDDLVKLADALFPHGVPPLRFESFSIVVIYEDGLPEFEMATTSPLSLDQLLAIIGAIEDGHVMYETVQPIERYTGDRDSTRGPSNTGLNRTAKPKNVKIRPSAPVVVTTPVRLPGPPEVHLPTAEESAALTRFVERLNAASNKRS